MHQPSHDPADDFVDVGDIDFDFDYGGVDMSGQQTFNINDDGTVTIIMDDAGPWPFPQGITTGSIGSGSVTGPGSTGASPFAPAGTIKVNVTQPSPQATPKFNFATQGATVKTDVSYVIVKDDGTTLELKEQNPITPKEMIGITKFINAVSSYLTVIVAHGTSNAVDMGWEKLVDNLGIRRHFQPGPPKGAYDTTGETIYIFLKDA